jgi:hypothetical protein
MVDRDLEKELSYEKTSQIKKDSYLTQTFGKFSKELFKNPKLGVALAIAVNLLFFISWKNCINLITILAYFVLFFVISGIVINKLNPVSEKNE